MFLVASFWLGKRIWLLPVITFSWIFCSIFFTYALSEILGHSTAEFPYISYTGTVEPESGIFTLTVALSAIMLAANFEIRFLFIQKVFEKCATTSPHWQRLNKAGLVLGLVSALGLLLVACFQVDTMKIPHYFGAFMCFFVAVGCIWVQVVLSYKIRHLTPNQIGNISQKVWQRVWYAQIALAVLATLLVLIFSISKTKYKFEKGRGKETKWDGLRGIFLLSTISEWLLTFAVAGFILTFIPSFRTLAPIKIESRFKEGVLFQEPVNAHDGLDLHDVHSSANGNIEV